MFTIFVEQLNSKKVFDFLGPQHPSQSFIKPTRFDLVTGKKFYSSIKQIKNKKALQQTLGGTSLVIWGKDLPSSVGLGRFTKQVNNMIKLPTYKKNVIIGLLHD